MGVQARILGATGRPPYTIEHCCFNFVTFLISRLESATIFWMIRRTLWQQNDKMVKMQGWRRQSCVLTPAECPTRRYQAISCGGGGHRSVGWFAVGVGPSQPSSVATRKISKHFKTQATVHPIKTQLPLALALRLTHPWEQIRILNKNSKTREHLPPFFFHPWCLYHQQR